MPSRLRQDQALMTRRRIVEAMRALIDEQGYTATTITAVAAAAGVAVPTVYKSFGTKAAIVKQLYDTTLAGDDDPVPLGERPEARALLAATDPREKIVRYADLAAILADRLAPLLSVLLGAAHAGDPELREFAATVERERLAGVEHFARNLAAHGIDVAHATDVLWAVTSPELHQRLVRERGWSSQEFRDWLRDLLTSQLLPSPQETIR